MTYIHWRYSTEHIKWQQGTACADQGGIVNLETDGREYQKMYGFGACFNERGYRALQGLRSEEREQVLRELFDPSGDGCHFTLCRLPIGANDYAESYYSLDEVPGDYALEHFSIARDRGCLIPYVKEAFRYQPDLDLFASPWTPPTWMKNPPVYNWGKLIWTPENLAAYANYFVRYVNSYKEEGIPIRQIHVQNEPVANQKFPSCMWTGAELREFIRDYLGPAFEKAGLNTEIWLGTINAPGCDYNKMIFDKWQYEDYDYFANEVLSDDDARKYISGVSYQWGGKIAVQRTFESWWPQIRLMQSENESGFSDNTWDYAQYNWTMLKHYIGNGCESYIYWNPILEPGGRSTWGDPQNSMITADPVSGIAQRNADYYVMRHFSSIIQRGAVRLGIRGALAGDALLFRNPDGSYAVEVFNPFREEKRLVLNVGEIHAQFALPPRSFNSMLIIAE